MEKDDALEEEVEGEWEEDTREEVLRVLARLLLRSGGPPRSPSRAPRRVEEAVLAQRRGGIASAEGEARPVEGKLPPVLERARALRPRSERAAERASECA
jgi:hypothetical protein